MSESFAELFEQSQIESKMRPGAIISAVVVGVNSDSIIVNAGLKSEGIIPIDQFFDENGDLEVDLGDAVDVALDSIEDGYGVRASHVRKQSVRLLGHYLKKHMKIMQPSLVLLLSE